MVLSRVQLSVLGLGAAVLLATENFDTRAAAQAAASNARRTTAVNPITGEEAETIVAKMMSAPPAVVAKAKAIYE